MNKDQRYMRIILKSHDATILDKTSQKIAELLVQEGVKISGPIVFPVTIEKWTLLRSPHVYKTARQQFERRTSKRVIFAVMSKTAVDVLENGQCSVPNIVGIEVRT